MTQDALRAALETLDGLATAVIAMKLAIPIGRPLGPEWQAFLARTGDVNLWLDENDRVQGRAALASPDTGVVEGAALDAFLAETEDAMREAADALSMTPGIGRMDVARRLTRAANRVRARRFATPAPEEAPE